MALHLWLLLWMALDPLKPASGGWLEPRDAVGQIDGKQVSGEVRVYVPALKEGERLPLVLALHGWDHSPALFQEKGRLAELAERYRVVVAVPETGRSIFETSFYRQTRGRWDKAPGARWVGEVVLPWLRGNLPVLSDKRHTAVIGYSTGGRGAFLLAQLYPEFGYVGSVSGTYDLMALDEKLGEYRIHKTIYGARGRFPERWEKDNVMARGHLDKLAGLHVYVGHGTKDKAVPVDQIRRFETALAKIAVASKVFVYTRGGGHDWALWNAHWPAMFEGFAASMR
jgi:enterochelin esterase-like enzyme